MEIWSWKLIYCNTIKMQEDVQLRNSLHYIHTKACKEIRKKKKEFRIIFPLDSRRRRRRRERERERMMAMRPSGARKSCEHPLPSFIIAEAALPLLGTSAPRRRRRLSLWLYLVVFFSFFLCNCFIFSFAKNYENVDFFFFFVYDNGKYLFSRNFCWYLQKPFFFANDFRNNLKTSSTSKQNSVQCLSLEISHRKKKSSWKSIENQKKINSILIKQKIQSYHHEKTTDCIEH